MFRATRGGVTRTWLPLNMMTTLHQPLFYISCFLFVCLFLGGFFSCVCVCVCVCFVVFFLVFVFYVCVFSFCVFFFFFFFVFFVFFFIF